MGPSIQRRNGLRTVMNVKRIATGYVPPSPRYDYYLSCGRFTVWVACEDGCIVDGAPIIKQFIGQPLENLTSWMKRFGKFKSRQIGKQTRMMYLDCYMYADPPGFPTQTYKLPANCRLRTIRREAGKHFDYTRIVDNTNGQNVSDIPEEWNE